MFASCGNKNNDTSDTTSKTETTAPEKEAVRVTVIAADTFVEGSYSGLAKAGLEKLEKDYGVKGTLKECGGKNFKAAMEEAAKSSDIIIPIGWQFESVDMDQLKKVDEVAYVRFASVYRQFTDVNTFVKEIEKLIGNKDK